MYINYICRGLFPIGTGASWSCQKTTKNRAPSHLLQHAMEHWPYFYPPPGTTWVNLKNAMENALPENIYNHETDLSDDPGRKKVVAKHGLKYVDGIIN